MIHSKTLLILVLGILFFRCNSSKKEASQAFNMEKDLLLTQFDCKTDVDDLHSVAALVTLLAAPDFSEIRYHAVAGTYGIQEGLYVPPNALFQLAFGDNWTDAHADFKGAVDEVKEIVKKTLDDGGDVWIAEAGQSDFTAELVKAIRKDLPELSTTLRIHVIQHSEWNEKSTTSESLDSVKKYTDYHKIPDGNEVGNGTPGFRDPAYNFPKDKITDPKLTEIWQLAIELSDQYNGKDGRYNNEAISAEGLDFSDLSEVCWIFGVQDIRDVEQFFDRTGCGNNKTPVEKKYTQVLSDSLQRIECDEIINELGKHKADTFGAVTSIPKDFEGCLDQLDNLTSEEMKTWIRCLPDGDFSSKVHFGFGMHLRNSWGLWSGSELSKNLVEMGIRHPDDMTGIILDSYQRRLKGEDIKLDEQIRYYQDYWEKTEMPKDSLLE